MYILIMFFQVVCRPWNRMNQLILTCWPIRFCHSVLATMAHISGTSRNKLRGEHIQRLPPLRKGPPVQHDHLAAAKGGCNTHVRSMMWSSGNASEWRTILSVNKEIYIYILYIVYIILFIIIYNLSYNYIHIQNYTEIWWAYWITSSLRIPSFLCWKAQEFWRLWDSTVWENLQDTMVSTMNIEDILPRIYTVDSWILRWFNWYDVHRKLLDYQKIFQDMDVSNIPWIFHGSFHIFS